MSLITQADFSRLCGVSRVAIKKAVDEGLIPVVFVDGNKKLIDTEDPSVIEYKNAVNYQRPSRNREQKPGEIESTSEFESLTPNEINRRSKFAEMQARELKVKILQKKYLSAELVDKYLFRYLEKLNSNLERIGAVYINDVGAQILDAGEVTPAIIQKFINMILTAIHETKQSIITEIENHEPDNIR